MDLQPLANLLAQSVEHTRAKAAETELKQNERQPQFSIMLLHIVSSGSFPLQTRLAGAVFFKNFIKRKWTDEEGNYLIPESDVVALKSEIIKLMISLPPVLQVQIGEAVSIMADSDFPDRWENLVPTLVEQLGQDAKTNNGVLTVAHSIFKRWRPLFRSDALFREIKLVLDQFSVPFLQLFDHTDRLIQENQANKQVLVDLFGTLHLIMKIYFDLNCQDIPEFFEDNLDTLMEKVHRYLTYSNPLLVTDDEDETGPIEKVKASICELLELYTQRYEEVFGKLIPKFVETTWTLLTNTGLEQKYDLLVSKALAFLTSVAKVQRLATIFEEPLDQVVRMIILPNASMRTSDEELFEDDPIEFIRRDLEGSDSDTRRRASTDFIRELSDKMESKVTQVMTRYVEEYLAQYAQNKAENWRSKDAAIYMFSAIAAKGSVTNAGVAATNLDVVEFFSKNIAPDLVNDDLHPILKVDAIKYIHTFRNQLTKPQLTETFGMLERHLGSNNYVVYTYSAITIERVLAMRDKTQSGLLFTKADVQPVAQSLLAKLFQLIIGNGQKSPEKLAENEFLMKCIMRILITAQEGIAPFGELLLQQLAAIVGEISKNPSNPKFNHYTFEAIGSVVRFCSQTVSPSKIEAVVMPVFMNVLQEDIQEFAPYVFQIFAQILRATPKDAGLSEGYQQLIRPLMSPALWEARGNIPALVGLLQAILVHGGSSAIVATGNLVPLLGVFQKLIASRVNDGYGLDLLEEVFLGISVEDLQQYLKQIGVLLLQRLQSSKTDRFVARLSRFVYFLSAVENRPGLGPAFAMDLFDNVQDGVFGPVLVQFILPATLKIQSAQDRKIAAVGLTKLLCQEQAFLTGKYSDKFAKGLDTLVSLLETEIPQTLNDDIALNMELDLEDASFGAAFIRLATTTTRNVDPAPSVPNPTLFAVAELKRINTQFNGAVKNMADLDDKTKAFLAKHDI
ncbi:importin alpha re-exporter [Trichomonascus vanleenenianus]|uniref:importin-alpha export receptor n=1 Tax=Trichomonascus vanleenenianus TaxID=2268995 RepID=UPI003ECA73A9